MLVAVTAAGTGACTPRAGAGLGSGGSEGGGASSPPAPPGFLKGQLHLHSSNSGDSQTRPEDVVRWYAARKYDFIVFTDHNQVTNRSGSGAMLVVPGVELTQNVQRCQPPPPAGMHCLLHLNALFVTPPAGGAVPWPPPPAEPVAGAGARRYDIFARGLEASRRLNGIAQLNHPNFDYAADGSLVAALAGQGLVLLEIANQAWDSNNVPADRRHASTEAIWDAALTAGAHVFATATDDAHHYDDAGAARARGEEVFTGDRGFVLVRAEKSVAAIRAALLAGDFYASTGVLLSRAGRSGGSPGVLEIEVAAASPGPHRFQLVGRGGQVLAQTEGRSARFDLAAARGGYGRAVVTDGGGRHAWLQPIWIP